MNRALHKMTDDERAELMAQFRADMHQMDEPPIELPTLGDWLGGAALAAIGLCLFVLAFGFGGPL